MSELVHTQEYDWRSFDPPMPVLDLILSRPGRHAALATFEAIIDTGADSTLIPIDILEQIAAPHIDQAYLRGITGTREPVDLYLVTVQIAGVTINGIRAAALPMGGATILGRDVLNHLHLALVGIATTTEVYI